MKMYIDIMKDILENHTTLDYSCFQNIRTSTSQ